MTANFVPLLAPANPMNYDTVSFYNAASGIVVGSGVGALSFRLLPPLSPAFRTRRLLALTLGDLRRIAKRRGPSDWRGRARGRLSAMPEQATPLQRAQLLAALTAGREIIALRAIARRPDLSADLEPALAAIAQGESARATIYLARLEKVLAAGANADLPAQADMRARGHIIALSDVLKRHAEYFDTAESL
jgi:uncharacterized membrane protein YccC